MSVALAARLAPNPREAEYQQVMAQLAEAEAERRAEVEAAIDWYDSEIAARSAAAADAIVAAEAATTRARQAAAVVPEVDREALKIWSSLRTHLGRGPGARLGEMPEPTALTGDPGGAPAPARHLRSANDLIEQARWPRPLPRWMYGLLPVAGAACAALVYLVAQGILLLGDLLPGGVGVALAVIGNIIVFLAPLSGLLAARYLTAREGARFDGGIVGPTVVGGLLAICLLIIALH